MIKTTTICFVFMLLCFFLAQYACYRIDIRGNELKTPKIAFKTFEPLDLGVDEWRERNK